jgi:hypothetical protein
MFDLESLPGRHGELHRKRHGCLEHITDVAHKENATPAAPIVQVPQ